MMPKTAACVARQQGSIEMSGGDSSILFQESSQLQEMENT